MLKNKGLKKRILEISYKHKLSHLGSCLTAVDIIEEIYQKMAMDQATVAPVSPPKSKFVLSSGHAGLALYCVIEKYGGKNAEEVFKHHGVHPDRCEECGLDCSTGSLGQGLPIAVGMALADRARNVYCLISDGECAEGSIHEALRIAGEQELENLKVYVNFNGWGAYKKIEQIEFPHHIDKKIRVIAKNTNMNEWPAWLQGQSAHYHTMTEEEYTQGREILQ